MNDLTLTQAVLNELLNRFNNYLAHIDNNGGTREHRHLSDSHKHVISTVAKVVGGALFFVPVVGPGIGNLVKDAGPFVAEELAKLHYDRLNKKIDNAGKVVDYVGNNYAVFFRKVAEQVVKENQEFTSTLPDTVKKQQRLAKYLAVNVFASVKHNASHSNNSLGTKVSETISDFKNARSQKVFASYGLRLGKC